MSISQALSAALAGINATQQALSVIAGNVANANTPGYVDESVNQIEVTIAGQAGASVDVTGVNRNLNTSAAEPIVDRNVRRFLRRHDRAALSAAPADLRHAGIVDLVRRDLQ